MFSVTVCLSPDCASLLVSSGPWGLVCLGAFCWSYLAGYAEYSVSGLFCWVSVNYQFKSWLFVSDILSYLSGVLCQSLSVWIFYVCFVYVDSCAMCRVSLFHLSKFYNVSDFTS
jgi:hypothetical protein